MIVRNLARLCVCASILFTLTIHAQDAPKSVQAKFLKQPKQAEKLDTFSNPKPFGKWFILSSVIYWGGSIADLASSQNGYEVNPLLRNPSGRVGNGKALLLTGSGYGLTLMIEKRHPKAATVLRFIVGGVRLGLAFRNLRQ
ncbi:MAG TPA: hypothetical protein VJT09_16500 [Pyrinomonadaceae bacterium]|nr:hypothetical protein [Pyrinomonadaceae bacterium]